MHPEIAKLSQTFTRFIEARIARLWQALRLEWEPKLIECLPGLADDCLAELKAGLAGRGRAAGAGPKAGPGQGSAAGHGARAN